MSIVAALLKQLFFQLYLFHFAILLGFQNMDLGILFVYLVSPTAVSSYVMARAMKSDFELSSNIILISTFFSMFTCLVGVFILKMLMQL